MPEPEGLLIEGARRAALAARDVWRRSRPPEPGPTLPLAHVKRRTELFLIALYREALPILPADPPPAPTWLARVLRRVPRHLAIRRALAGTDGACVWLPRAIEATDGEPATAATYRLWAVEQAARAARGTPSCVCRDRLERDLYLLSEAVAVDVELARAFTGLAPEIGAARMAALRERPAAAPLTDVERTVEDMIRAVLASDPAIAGAAVPLAATPPDSLVWARATAARLRSAPMIYRGVPAVALWGDVHACAAGDSADEPPAAEPHASPRRSPRSAPLRRRPRVRQASEDEDDGTAGTWMVRADEPMQSAEDPMGLQRPADGDDDADAADLADSVSELAEARVVRTLETPREVLDNDAGTLARAHVGRGEGSAGVVYPEWDYRVRAYRERGAVVRPGVVPPGSGEWVDSVMARHAALVSRVRRRFEGLRPQRARSARQADGDELDVAAYVTAFADWRARRAGDDRLYIAARPARRDLAIALLVDTSSSTDAWVAGSLRIIDVEKESLILLLEALDALGDRHAAFAFAGDGPRDVRVATVKAFDERVGLEVRRRVAGLEPDGYTRVGAALRHTSGLLAGQPARHKLLLLLSDGKPNDVDEYEGRYGIEDTRQAVAEARLQGLVPFCLTVDRDAPAYMPAIFGRYGFTMLRRQEFLPAVVPEVIRRLLVA